MPREYGPSCDARPWTGETARTTTKVRDFDPVVGTNLAELESTQAAAAKEIYARVYAAQGPNGPLATLALERHPAKSVRGAPVKSWWSPADGTLGYPDRVT